MAITTTLYLANRRALYAFLLAYILLLFSALNANAATKTWDGGGANNNWSTAANWSPNGVPANGDDVIFDGTSAKNCTYDAADRCRSITVEATYGGQLTFSAVNARIDRNFTVNGATVDASAATLDIRRSFTLAGGSFTAPSGTMEVDRNFDHNGGTWNHNNGTVQFAAGGNRDLGTASGTLEFYNFILDKNNGSTLDIDAGDLITVTNSLSLLDGNLGGAGTSNTSIIRPTSGATALNFHADFDGGDGILEIDHARTINLPAAMTMCGFKLEHASAIINAGANLPVEGSMFINTGTFNDGGFTISTAFDITIGAAGTYTATGTLEITGGDNGQFIDVNNTATFNNITINKTSGREWDIAENDKIVCNGTLTLTDGEISRIAGTAYLEMGPASTFSPASTFDGGNAHLLLSSARSIILADGMDMFGIMITDGGATVGFGGTASVDFEESIRMGGGTWFVTSGDLSFADSVDVDAGTFNLPSGNMYMNGVSVNVYFGAAAGVTVTHNSGTFHGTGARDVRIDLDLNQNFNNIVINLTSTNANRDDFVVVNADMICNGTLTMTDGQLNGQQIQCIDQATCGTAFSGGTGRVYFTSGAVRTINFTAGDLFLPEIQCVTSNVTLNLTNNGANFVDVERFDWDNGVLNLAACSVFVQQAFDQDGGTVNGGSGDVVCHANLRCDGGTHNATTGTMSMVDGGHSFVVAAAGTFVHNNGTVELAGADGDITVTHGANVDLYNLIINQSHGTNDDIEITNFDMVVANQLTLTDGEINQGEIEVTGTITAAATFDGGSGRIHINGAGTRTINLTPGTFELPALRIDAANATVNLSTTGTVSVEGDLDMDAGTLNIQGAKFDIETTVNHSGGTITQTTGEYEVGGGYTMSAGTFTGGAGDLDFDGGFAQSGGGFTTGAGGVDVVNAVTLSGTGTFNSSTSGTCTFRNTYTQTTGTSVFNASAGGLDITADFSLTDGSFTAPPGTWAIRGDDFTMAGAYTFTHNSGLASFSRGTSDIRVSLASNTTFNDVTINMTSGSGGNDDFVIQSSDLISAGTLTLTDGEVLTGTIQAQDDVTASTLFDGGATGTLHITGAGTRTINLTAGTFELPGLLIDAANATINLSTSGTVTVEDDLDMDNGTLNIQGGKLQITTTVNHSNGTITQGAGEYEVTNGYTMSGGTFTGGAGEVDLNGGFAQSAGSFTSGTGNMDVVLAFTLSGTGAFTTSSSGTLSLNSTYTQTGGGSSFTGSAGNMTLPGDFSLTDGSFTSVPGTFTFTGNNFTTAGAPTFTHNSGTVNLNDNTDITLSLVANTTFNNLTINQTSGGGGNDDINITSSDAIVVGTLTLTDGEILTGTIQARGDITAATTFDGGASGTININGGAVRTINLNPGTFELPNMTINDANATINLSASGTVTMEARLDMDAGTLNVLGGMLDVVGLVDMTGGTITQTTGEFEASANMQISGGTFTGGAGEIDINTVFTMSGGAFATGDGNADMPTLTQTGGTFTGGAGTLNTTNFNLSDGGSGATFNAGSGTLEVRYWTHNNAPTNAAFNGGTGTVEFDQGTPTITCDHTKETFNNLTLNSTGGVFAPAVDLDINGDLTISNRRLDLGSNAIDLELGGDLTITSGTSDAFSPGTRSVTLDGTSGTQTLSSTNQDPEVIHSLTLNHSGSGISLGSNFAISGTATFTNGVITSTSANQLRFNVGSSVASASDASHVTGPVEKLGDSDFTFPLGDDGNYQPVTLSGITGGGGSGFVCEYSESDPHLAGYNANTSFMSGGLTHVGRCEYWDISISAGVPTATLAFAYDANSCGIDDLPSLEVAHWDSGTPQWELIDATAAAGTITTNANVSSFSPFTLGSTNTNNNPLPIELIFFSAEAKDKTVGLSWATASELNNDYFTVERSVNGIDWEVVTEQSGAGNSSSRIDYSAVDYNPYAGTSYYRLKQTDYDGAFEYSDIVSVEMTKEAGEVFNVYPNPGNGQAISIDFLEETNGEVQIELFDAVGRLLYSYQVSGDQRFEFPERLATGVYHWNVTVNNIQYSKKQFVN